MNSEIIISLRREIHILLKNEMKNRQHFSKEKKKPFFNSQ